MSIGIEHEFGIQEGYFLKREDRYEINTEEVPRINPDFTLLINRMIGQITWDSNFFELVPIAGIFEEINFPQDYKWIDERLKKYKVANLIVQEYLRSNSGYFEKGKKIPEKWNKFEILFLGTIAQKIGSETNPLIVQSLAGYQVSLDDVEIMKNAKALVYKL